MKCVVLICMMAATALAAPRYKRTTKLDPTLAPQVSAAEQAWSAAEREPDRAKQVALWEQAAAAFGDIDAAAVDAKVKREAAYAAVLAWKNALDNDPAVSPPPHGEVTPRPLPARAERLLAALDRYAKYADAADAELPGVLYMKALTYARHDQLDAAVSVFVLILEQHRTHEIAEYAANLLLDSYNRLHQYDKLVALATELANDAALVKRFPELGKTARTIQLQAARRHIERQETDARSARDLDKWSAVANAYLDLYNTDPKAPHSDELLYNAGVAFESGRAIDASIHAFTRLRRQFPTSKLVPRALARLGRIYSGVAQLDKAAAVLEEYARRYAGEKDAADALRDAIYYRKALGDRDTVVANTHYFVKLYGRKKPREAADAFWSLIALYDSEPNTAIKYLRTYLRLYGSASDAVRVVAAHAQLGRLIWRQSCPHATVDGLCVKVTSRTRTCGGDKAPTWTVTARAAGKRKEALAAFALATKEYERRRLGGDSVASYHYAQAKLALADATLESYLELAFPANLSFDPTDTTARTASTKRFQGWLEMMTKIGGQLTRAYQEVVVAKDPPGSITAAARIGIVSDSFASRLVTAAVPRDVRTGPHAPDKVKAYCDAMREAAAPLEHRALEAYGFCLARSTELPWFGDSSAYCERELQRRKPDEYPASTELRAQAGFVGPVLASEPPVHGR